MYRTSIMLSCFLVWVSGCSLTGKSLTEYQAPAAVLSAFRLEYPEATEVEYSELTQRGIKAYRVEFDMGGLRHEVNYTLQGKPVNFEKKDEEPAKPGEADPEDSGSPAEETAAHSTKS